MNKFIPASEYIWLCDKCQNKLTQITQALESQVNDLSDIQLSDDELPCNWMYDNELFCGGWSCENRKKELIK